jgi:hypothetical protein
MGRGQWGDQGIDGRMMMMMMIIIIIICCLEYSMSLRAA